MQSSPLQLKKHIFRKVHIEPTEQVDEIATIEDSSTNFDFEGVTFRVGLTSAFAEDQANDPSDFAVVCEIAIENTVGKRCPYTIDIELQGFFTIDPRFAKPREREDIVLVNGASILYGAIREMVLTITSRSIFGAMQLPTMDFRDHIGQNNETKKSAASAGKAAEIVQAKERPKLRAKRAR